MNQRDAVWVAAHLVALGMLFVGGWITVAGFLLMVLLPRYKTWDRTGEPR